MRAYAYDSSQKDKIAEGVTIGGVDVGGMDAEEAKRAVRAQLLAPLATRSGSATTARAGSCRQEAEDPRRPRQRRSKRRFDESRDGGLPGRLARYVTGGDVDEHDPRRRHLLPARGQPFRPHGRRRDQPGAAGRLGRTERRRLAVVPAENGRKLRDNLLTEQLNAAVLNADADRTIAARTHSTAPEVTGSEVAAEYPSYLTLDRASYTLRLWKT